MLQRTWYAVQSAVGSALSVVLVMLQIIQWMMYLTVICFGCWTIYSGVRAIWCGSLVARLHGEWAVTLLSTSLRAASGYCAMTILVFCKLLVGCRALQLILQTGHHRKSFFILLITMAFLQVVDATDAGVDYQEMCSEWNSIVVEEMKDIKDVAGDIEVDDLFDRLRLKTSCQLSSYAGVMTDRYAGVKALQPYLREYKQLCHDLKQANADDVLPSPQVECKAQTPVPGRRLVREKAALPMPSNFAGSASVRSVYVSSVALAPRNVDVPTINNAMPAPQSTAHCQNTKHSKRSHTTTSPQSRKAAKKTSGKAEVEGKLELCSQCFVRCAGALEVVYVEFPDKDKLADLHGGRQNSTNKMRNCPKYISELSGDEKVTWKTALQRMRRDGTLTNMYRKFAKEHYGP